MADHGQQQAAAYLRVPRLRGGGGRKQARVVRLFVRPGRCGRARGWSKRGPMRSAVGIAAGARAEDNARGASCEEARRPQATHTSGRREGASWTGLDLWLWEGEEGIGGGREADDTMQARVARRAGWLRIWGQSWGRDAVSNGALSLLSLSLSVSLSRSISLSLSLSPSLQGSAAVERAKARGSAGVFGQGQPTRVGREPIAAWPQPSQRPGRPIRRRVRQRQAGLARWVQKVQKVQKARPTSGKGLRRRSPLPPYSVLWSHLAGIRKIGKIALGPVFHMDGANRLRAVFFSSSFFFELFSCISTKLRAAYSGNQPGSLTPSYSD